MALEELIDETSGLLVNEQAEAGAMQPSVRRTDKKLIIAVVAMMFFTVGCVVFCTLFITARNASVQPTVFSTGIEFSEKQFQKLEVPERVKILNLADLHIKREFTQQEKEIIQSLVAEAQPDLITLTGDQFESASKEAVKQFVEFIDAFEIPWAPVHGNHDREQLSNEWIGQQYEDAAFSLFRRNYDKNLDGNGNYVVSLMHNGTNLYNLIFLDSHAKKLQYLKLVYDNVHENQIVWYKWVLDGLRQYFGKSELKSIIFEHIPLPEYKYAVQNVLFGEKTESMGLPGKNSGEFTAILDGNSTTHVICGHDHLNNFFGVYQNIVLGYGIKTGTSGYHDDKMVGGTVITVTGGDVEIEHIYL